MAPFVAVKRRADGVMGTLMFTTVVLDPGPNKKAKTERRYFGFQEDKK
jgi:hypothetical protein